MWCTQQNGEQVAQAYSKMDNSPEKWLCNRDYHPSNRSKQIQETHTITAAKFECCARSHAWMLFIFQTLPRVLCEFLGTVWTYCRNDNPHCTITSPANWSWHRMKRFILNFVFFMIPYYKCFWYATYDCFSNISPHKILHLLQPVMTKNFKNSQTCRETDIHKRSFSQKVYFGITLKLKAENVLLTQWHQKLILPKVSLVPCLRIHHMHVSILWGVFFTLV